MLQTTSAKSDSIYFTFCLFLKTHIRKCHKFLPFVFFTDRRDVSVWKRNVLSVLGLFRCTNRFVLGLPFSKTIFIRKSWHEICALKFSLLSKMVLEIKVVSLRWIKFRSFSLMDLKIVLRTGLTGVCKVGCENIDCI